MSNLVIGGLQGPSVLSTTPYPNTWKQAVDYITQNTEVVTELTAADQFFNFGDSVPAAEYQAYPWIRTTDDRVYRYHSGAWLARHPLDPASSELRLWIGSLANLQTHDGGDTNSPGDASGPMWEEYTAAQGRFPIHPATLPVEGAIGPTSIGGVETVTIAQANLPAVQLDVPIPASDTSQSDTGAGRIACGSDTVEAVDGPTLQTEALGSGTALSVLNRYIGIYVIRRTSRIYFKAA